MSKHKPALPERLYCRLADAAQFLGCSADDLLHYGACGYLEIIAAANDVWAQKHLFDELEDGTPFSSPSDIPTQAFGFFSLSAVKLACIERSGECRVSGAMNAYMLTRSGLLAGISELFEDDDCRHGGEQPSEFFTISARHPDQENLSEQEHLSDDSIKVVAADLWVRTEELRRFQKEGSSHVLDEPELPPDNKKPHGNTENNARNRESVLMAAIAVKTKFPDQCGTYRDWAETIDAKAPLFWPETGSPPLKPETIERLLGESHKPINGK